MLGYFPHPPRDLPAAFQLGAHVRLMVCSYPALIHGFGRNCPAWRSRDRAVSSNAWDLRGCLQENYLEVNVLAVACAPLLTHGTQGLTHRTPRS